MKIWEFIHIEIEGEYLRPRLNQTFNLLISRIPPNIKLKIGKCWYNRVNEVC